MAAFPSYARLLVAGYEVSAETALRRTEMDAGPPKQRQEKSRVMVNRALSYELRNREDYDNFMVWFRDTINRGVDWFDWHDPETLTVRQARIKGGELKRTPVNAAFTVWRVSFVLESWDA